MLSAKTITLTIILAPLVGSVLTGLLNKNISRSMAHWLTCSMVFVSFVLSLFSLINIINGKYPTLDEVVYIWGIAGNLNLEVGILVDKLSTVMATVVTFVSLMVHVYTIGYMHDDPGYQRFFSYISLFTFAMLTLVFANNFLQLFFGWEAVGLVSYLLIGFWYKKPTAIFANLKAFLVNRVGDFGFLLGIATVVLYFGSLQYSDVFALVNEFVKGSHSLNSWGFTNIPAIDVICIGLFIGAMGKSAQVPLHVWLPDSMEGPTPISALIHAATMVTAGVFMVARMSPLFENSEFTLNFILVIGSLTCFFMGILGLVQNDIKRIVAYSTLSQLGYMVVALGVSAYAAGIFHLVTHAFFKAVLFLGAGSVIIALHHEQDIFKMGNLKKYMPITYWCMLLSSLALIGFPGFSGFYSKDLIIQAVHMSDLSLAKYAYWAVLLSVFVTSLYSFRLFFIVFHGNENLNQYAKQHVCESPKVVTVPLILLTIPAVVLGFVMIKPILMNWFGASIQVMEHNDVIAKFNEHHFHGALNMFLHGFISAPFWLGVAGIVTAYVLYIKCPNIPVKLRSEIRPIYTILRAKYGFDLFNETILAPTIRTLAWFLFRIGDKAGIDGLFVNGSARTINVSASMIRRIQTGYLFHYTFAVIAGIFVLLVWLLWQ